MVSSTERRGAGVHWCRVPAGPGAPRPEQTARLHEVLDRAEDDPHCAALVLDLRESGVDGDEVALSLWSKWEKAVARLERARVPTIGVAAGAIRGTALNLVLAVDLRIVAPGTTVAVDEVGGGDVPGMLLYRLARCAGLGHAKRIVFGAAVLGAEEASRLGLVDLVTDSRADAAADAADRAARAGSAWYLARRLMLESYARDVDDAIGGFLAVRERIRREGSA